MNRSLTCLLAMRRLWRRHSAQQPAPGGANTFGALACGLWTLLTLAALQGCGGGGDEDHETRGTTQPVDCVAKPSDCV